MLKILCQELPLSLTYLYSEPADEVPDIFRAATDGLIRRRVLNSPDRK
jgi:hypothetical protein